MKILIMNGPNLNMLGVREPEIYGSETLSDINNYILKTFEESDVKLDFYQSNHEGDLIDKIHSTIDIYDGVVYNPGAHTHYSYALRDAISSVPTPFVECHLSDINNREPFRKKSVIRPACEEQVFGKGKDSYVEAINLFLNNTGDIFWRRDVKTDVEIEILKEAQRMSDEAFLKTLPHIKEGMTEIQVRDILEKNLYDCGAEDLSFPTIVGAGSNGANPHAEPSNNVLKTGDAVVIDFGIKYKNYCSDTTRTVLIGEVSDKIKHAYVAVREANETVEKELKPGMSGSQAHELALGILKNHGLGDKMPHGLGHGVGIDIHEKPVLAPRGKQKLKANQVMTVEPGVYFEGEFGIRLEDTGVLTDDGYKPFGTLTHEMIIC